MAETEETQPPETLSTKLKRFIRENAVLIILGFMLAQNAGWITSEQVSELKKLVLMEESKQEESTPAPTPEDNQEVAPEPKRDDLTPQQIADLISNAIDETLKKRKLLPVADDVTPSETESVRIKVCDQNGQEITTSEVEAGQLFRVSAVGCGDLIGWQPVKSGDVKLSASTDGKEYCGYLAPGQWIEFGLTDFASKTQVSLRVTCLTAPQPPPVPDDDKKTDPQPQPTAKNVRLFVVHNPDRITPDAAIVLNANDMWDAFTAAGNDWKFVDIGTDDEYERQIVSDASGIGLPAIVVYDKATGKKLAAEELPKSVIATEGLVERYTGVK